MSKLLPMNGRDTNKNQQKLNFITKNKVRRATPEAACFACVGAPVFVVFYEVMVRKSFGVTENILTNSVPKYCGANMELF
jgi:hypothetical protein